MPGQGIASSQNIYEHRAYARDFSPSDSNCEGDAHFGASADHVEYSLFLFFFFSPKSYDFIYVKGSKKTERKTSVWIGLGVGKESDRKWA